MNSKEQVSAWLITLSTGEHVVFCGTRDEVDAQLAQLSEDVSWSLFEVERGEVMYI